MRKVIVSELVTLDGVMEEPEWTLPWLDEEYLSFKFGEVLASDALLLGRVTYQGFAEAWPGMDGSAFGRILPDGFAKRMNSLPKYVVSTTLGEPLAWNNSRLIQSNVQEQVAALKQQPGQDILVVGSAGLVGTLLQHHLVDEYRLLTYPLVLGKGKRLFADGASATLQLVEARPFRSGLVLLTYTPAPSFTAA